MFRRFNLFSAAFALALIFSLSALAHAQSQKGWDGKVQGKVLVTPVTVNFDNPADYDNFASGKLRINLILKNTLSGQTIRLDSRQLVDGFRSGPDKRTLTINVIVDNMSAPLSEAACGVISPSAENTADGVNITLSYSGCDSSPAQRPGAPIKDITVKGGKIEASKRALQRALVRGNLNIVVGDSRVTSREEASAMSREAGVIPAFSGKGSGSPKQAGF